MAENAAGYAERRALQILVLIPVVKIINGRKGLIQGFPIQGKGAAKLFEAGIKVSQLGIDVALKHHRISGDSSHGGHLLFLIFFSIQLNLPSIFGMIGKKRSPVSMISTKGDTSMKHILLLGTGGTIACKHGDSGLTPLLTGDELLSYVPAARSFCEVEAIQVLNIDSTNIHPKHWQLLCQVLEENYDNYDGFVICHGTDTMAYTASALSFMLEGLNKPVILTGSQLPIGVLRTDGKENLLTSIEIATARHSGGRPIVPEVCIFFENHLMRGNRTTKINAENFNAFRSYNYPVLASAGIHIKYNNVQIHTENTHGQLRPHYLLDTDIAILKLFPGIQESVVDAILAIKGLKAVVLETYGSGNAPRKEWFLRRLHDACEQGVVIVNVTQCNAGTVEMERYETGYRLMQAGVVCGYDSTTESAVTKLMFLLGHNYSPAEVRELMNRPIAGEITI